MAATGYPRTGSNLAERWTRCQQRGDLSAHPLALDGGANAAIGRRLYRSRRHTCRPTPADTGRTWQAGLTNGDAASRPSYGPWPALAR